MIVVNITDAKPQYLQSAINACALPIGAIIPLRYRTKWVQKSILDLVAKGSPLPPLSLFFLSGNRGDLRDSQAIPMREATVKTAMIVGDFLAIDARVGQFYDESFIAACSSGELLASLLAFPKEGHYVFEDPGVVTNLASTAKNTAAGWQSATNRLASTPALTGAHFCFIEKVIETDRGPVSMSSNGELILAPDRHYEAFIHTATRDSSTVGQPHIATLALTPDLGDISDVPDIPLITNYDHRTIAFRTQCTRRRSRGTLFLSSIVPLSPEVTVKAMIPEHKGLEVLHRSFAGLGAAFVGSAGVLPESTPLVIKIALILTGAIVIAITQREVR